MVTEDASLHHHPRTGSRKVASRIASEALHHTRDLSEAWLRSERGFEQTVPESTMKLSVLQPPPHPPSHGWDLVLRLFKFPPPNERFDLSPVDYSWGGKEPKDHRSHAFSLLASPLLSLRWSPAFHPLLCRLYAHAFNASCQSMYTYMCVCVCDGFP